MDMEITSINEYVSSTYGKDNIPEDLLEACRVEALYEATKREVQLKVYFQQTFDSLKKKEWTTDMIDKEIKKIEKCNRSIESARKGGKAELDVLKSSVWWKDKLKHMFYGAALGTISGIGIMNMAKIIGAPGLAGVISGGLAAGMVPTSYIDKRNRKYNSDGSTEYAPYEALYRENEKALKWLKEERERILNGTVNKKKLGDIITGKQESTIFANIEII